MSLDTLDKEYMKKQTQQLAEEYYFNPCNQLKERFFETNQSLIWYLINKHYKNIHLLQENELFSLGLTSFNTAIEAYDPTKKAKFSTYAGTCFRNTVGMEIRKIKYRRKKILYLEDLEVKISGEESDLAYNESFVKEFNFTFNELLVEEIIERKEEKRLSFYCINEALSTLTQRERYTVEHAYELNHKQYMSQQEIADTLSVSRATIVRTCQSAKNKILNYLLDTTNPKITSHIIQTIIGGQ